MILIWADSRWRDAFGLALLSYELDKLNVPNLVVPFDITPQIVEKAGRYISGTVLNHTIGNRNRQIIKKTKINDGSVFVMPTEGKPTPENEQWFFDNNTDYDLLFTWTSQFNPPKSVITGSPRFQIYTHYSQFIENKDYVLDKYKIDRGNESYVFVSSYPQAKFLYSGTQFLTSDWKDLKREGAIDNAKQSMLDLSCFMGLIKNAAKKSVNIIIRPHPMEDLSFWERFQYELKLETGVDSHLVSQDYIFNCLQIADTWVHDDYCTTILDYNLHRKYVLGVDDKLGDWASDVTTDIDSAREIARLIKENTNMKPVPRDVYSSVVDLLKHHNSHTFMPTPGAQVGKSVPLSVLGGWKGKIRNG